MFGLLKQKISKRDYGQIIASNALQYLDEVTRGVDSILNEHFSIVKGSLAIENNYEQIFTLQLAACVAVGELSFYSMDRNGISVYEARNGFLEHVENIRTGVAKKHNTHLNVDFLKISQEISSLITKNDFLASTGKFYSNEGFNQKDIYGQIAIYLFNLATKSFPDFQKLIFHPDSLNGALQIEMGIDRAFRFVCEMYKSYKFV